MFFWILFALLHLGLFALMFYSMRCWPGLPARPSEDCKETVSLLIPARNEEAHIAAAIEQALRGSPGIFEVLIYNDHSTDRTGDEIARVAAADPRVRVVSAEPLPEGWCGKPFACRQLARAARGDWLLFQDADTRLQTDAVARMLADTKRYNVTFLSCWPGLVMEGVWEKLCMPMLNFVVFTLFPAPLSLKRQMPALGLAHGACILMRREEYERIGGHELVKPELFEDTALARAWRAHGLRGICLDGQDVVRVRMYDSWSSLWNGFQKIFYPAFRHEVNFWLFLLFHIVFFIVPFVLAPVSLFTGGWLLMSWLMVAAILGSRLLQAIRFGYSLPAILFHPLTECGLIAVALASRHKCRRGAGVPWRGRNYKWKAS